MSEINMEQWHNRVRAMIADLEILKNELATIENGELAGLARAASWVLCPLATDLERKLRWHGRSEF